MPNCTPPVCVALVFRVMHDLFVNRAYLVRRLGLFFVVGAPAPTPFWGGGGGTVDGVVGAFGLNYLISDHINYTWFNIYHIRAKGFNLPYPLKKDLKCKYRCLWVCNEKIPVYLVWRLPLPPPLFGEEGGVSLMGGPEPSDHTSYHACHCYCFSIFNY